MNIGVIGLGYVGLITGVGFASMGHTVKGFDLDADKVKALNQRKSPLYEVGLDVGLKESGERFTATQNLSDLNGCEVIFICVGTPSREDGSIDLYYVKKAAEDLSKMLDSYKVIVVKSTVVPGTTDGLIPILEQEGKLSGKDFGVAMSPEFLREGTALKDFFDPDRIVIGATDEKTRTIMLALYEPFNCPKIFTNLKTAEMIKYASNAFLATKISFINEIGNICKKLGIDTYHVADGIGYDKRIGRAFLDSGIGFGGSCFPKDVKALISMAESLGEEPKILKEVIHVNEKQPLKKINLIKKRGISLKDKKVAVLGLAFKPHTDDVRESRAVPIIEALLREGAVIYAHDPEGAENMRKIFPEEKHPNIFYIDSPQDAIEMGEIILLTTDWPHFKGLDFMGKPVFDGRNVIPKEMRDKMDYEGVCW